jgi:hypothetical protein
VVRALVANRYEESPGCYRDFVDQTWEILAMGEPDLLAERARFVTLLAPYVARDTRKPYTDAVVAEYQETLRRYIAGRRAKLAGMIPP